MRAVLGIGHRRAWGWLASSQITRRLGVAVQCLDKKELKHTPVLLKNVLGYFEERDLKVWLDCTLGAGGHTSAIIQQHPVRHSVSQWIEKMAAGVGMCDRCGCG